MTERLSNRQFIFLQMAAKKGGLSLDEMLTINQQIAGTMVRRNLMAWRSTLQTFTLTTEGLNVVEMFIDPKHEDSDLERKGTNRPLSVFIQHKDLDKRGVTKAHEPRRNHSGAGSSRH